MESSFPNGVVVFFRLMAEGQNFARSVHPRGRYIKIGGMDQHEDDYVVLDIEQNFLGCYPREFVAAILPLEITGPGTADVGNQSSLAQH